VLLASSIFERNVQIALRHWPEEEDIKEEDLEENESISVNRFL
jgi:hypothetical protein